MEQNENVENTFGNMLKNVMKQQRINQVELSEKSGISQPTISCYLSGKMKPKIEQVFKIANAIGIQPYELLEHKEIVDSSVKCRNEKIKSLDEKIKDIIESIDSLPIKDKMVLYAKISQAITEIFE